MGYDAETMRSLVQNNKEWAVGALLILYKKDLLFPQDQAFLSSLAESYLRTEYLTDKQIYFLKKGLIRYIKRLPHLDISPVGIRKSPNFSKSKTKTIDKRSFTPTTISVSIEGRRAYFEDSDSIEDLRRALTWEDDDSECLLFQDGDRFFTYYGLLKPLSLKYGFIFEYSNNWWGGNSKPYTLKKNPLKNIDLYDYQLEAIERCITDRNGIIQVATGGGKTEIILGVLKELLDKGMIKKALVIVPSVGLAQQFYERGLNRGFTKNDIGILFASSKDVSKKITCGVINSIHLGLEKKDKKILSLLNSDVLIYDECHHMGSMMNLEVADKATSPYLLGFSASPFKEEDVLEDSSDALLHGIAGRVIYQISPGELARRGVIATPIVYFKKITDQFLRSSPDPYNAIYTNFIVKNDERNKQIVKYAKLMVNAGHKTLILVQRKGHAIDLLKRINNPRSICIFGGSSGHNLKGALTNIDYNQFREDFQNDKYDIIIGTPVMDEGFDMPVVGAFINAGGGRSKKKLIQKTGRTTRKKKQGPNEVYICDFYDYTHVYLEAQSKKRAFLYNRELEAIFIDKEDDFIEKVER